MHMLFENTEGLFRLLPDPEPFEAVADLIESVRVVKKRDMHPFFQNTTAVACDGGDSWLNSHKSFALVGIEERSNSHYLECKLMKRQSPLTFWLPMSCRGMFLECLDDELYSIDTIVNWKILKGRNRMVEPSAGFHDSRLIPANFLGYLVLHPSFSAQVVLEDGQEMLLSSNLDIFITECHSMKNPEMLLDVVHLSQIYDFPDERFPLAVRIVDIVAKPNFKWIHLSRGQRLQLLRKDSINGYFISEDAAMPFRRRCFFVPDTYQGLVNRRSREFKFVYDVFLASNSGKEICFEAGQCFKAESNVLSSFQRGEAFRTIRNAVATALINGEAQDIEVLECESIMTKSIVWLPFYAEGQFMELLVNRAKPLCTIKQFASANQLPCHINVVMQDPSLPSDPLYNISKLKIDKSSSENCLISQSIDSDSTFIIPVDLMKMLVCLVAENSRKNISKAESNLQSFNFIEIPATQYLSAVDYEELPLPPPRPPKFNKLSGCKAIPHAGISQGTPRPSEKSPAKDCSKSYLP